MPKEVIHPHHPPIDGENLVQVVWGRDTIVQVGVRESGDEVPGENALYTDLSRQQINDMIRVLRRARDQAYGQDA